MSNLLPRQLVVAAALLLMSFGAVAAPVTSTNTTVTIPGVGSFNCRVVTVDIKHGGLAPKLIFARDGIGRTEPFSAMLQRSHAMCGINGSFFDAYNKVGDMDPGMTLITGGSVVHKGGTGTVCGFSSQGDMVMGKLDLPIKGTVTVPGKRPGHWYAYWLNRKPTSADNIAVFTPARGERARVSDGMTVVVRRNTVVRVVEGDAAIPRDGYVINFRGDSGPQTALFPLGAIVSFTVSRKSERNEEAWQDVQEGPRLLTDGSVTYSPEDEGFISPKILSLHGLRSAIGVTRDGKVLLVTASGPTVLQLAQVMLKLGAVHAMNLDGGASSGLFCSGSMLTMPGRELSNALVFVKK